MAKEKKVEEEKEENQKEEVLQSLVIETKKTSDDENDQDEDETGIYNSKGPVRNNVSNERQTPYQLGRQRIASEDDDALMAMGKFLDELENIFPGKAEDEDKKVGIPGLPNDSEVKNKDQLLLNGLDNLFDLDSSVARIIIRNDTEPNGISVMPSPVTVGVDEKKNQFGIYIPKMVIPSPAVYQNRIDENKVEISIQLDPTIKRLIKVAVRVEMMMQGRETWMIKSQFVRLQPFSNGSFIKELLEGVSQEEMDNALKLTTRKSIKDLVHPHGPNADTILMLVCCQKDTTESRAQLFAVVKKILAEIDPHIRRNIIQRNVAELSALDYCCVFNKSRAAKFLSEVFYILGDNLMRGDKAGNNILHLMARTGDEVSHCLESLFSLRYEDNRKVFPSTVRNKKNDLPLHVAAMSFSCPHNMLMLFYHDNPEGFVSVNREGNFPLHLACQMTKDPTLIANLLRYNSSMINYRRGDGMTPLHLVASRNDIEERDNKVIALDDENQVKMIRILLEFGADKSMKLEGFLPIQLLDKNRTKARLLLKVNCDDGSPCPDTKEWQNNYPLSPNSLSYSQMSPTSLHSSGPPSVPESQLSGSPTSSTFYSQASPFSGTEEEPDDVANLDAIAALLIQHPTIREVLDSNDPDMGPK